jgi:hypothetical protein
MRLINSRPIGVRRMREQPTQLTRGGQVLTVLADHGPLTIRGLETVLRPAIKRRALRAVLQRLQENGFLNRRYDRLFGGSAVHYQISRDPRFWSYINQTIGRKDTEFKQSYFSHRELRHSEACAVWAEEFKRWLPQALVLRDHQYCSDRKLLERLILSSESASTLPDILIFLPAKDETRRVVIGVEIERTRKTDKRLAQKLAKYAIRTRLDAVIYISETDRILDAIRAIYSSTLIKKALRISHYGHHFLMLSTGRKTADGSDLMMANAALGNMNFKDWAQHLVERSHHERRDKYFTAHASGSFIN